MRATTVVVLLLLGVSTSWAQEEYTIISLDNYVASFIDSVAGYTKTTFDPGNPLIVKGRPRRSIPPQSCLDGGPIESPDGTWILVDAGQSPAAGTQHLCAGDNVRVTNPNPQTGFDYHMRGGGVSWTEGDPFNDLGATIWIVIHEPWQGSQPPTYWDLVCGDGYEFPPLMESFHACGIGPGASRSPEIYGNVGSPDLTGNLGVDAGDISAFSTYLGLPVTITRGWQADFNDSGPPTVDAADAAYLAGRVGKNCYSQKAGGDEYDMRVENLSLGMVQELLAKANLTKTDVLRLWDEMGYSYDRAAAATISSAPPSTTSWGHVKSLYKG